MHFEEYVANSRSQIMKLEGKRKPRFLHDLKFFRAFLLSILREEECANPYIVKSWPAQLVILDLLNRLKELLSVVLYGLNP